MFSFFLVIFSVLFVAIMYHFYIVVCGRVRYFTITSFFCLCYLCFAYIGSILINILKFEQEEFMGMYNRPDILFEMWIFLTIGLFMFVVGFAFSNIVFNKNNFPIISHQVAEKSIRVLPLERKRSYFLIILFLFISFISFLLYRDAIGKLPIEFIFSSDGGAGLAFLRSEATNNFSGKIYRYAIFMETIPLFLFILTSLIRDKSKKWSSLYLLLFAYNAFYALCTLQKAPILKFLLLCCIIYFFKKGRIEKKLLVYLISFALLLIPLMYVLFMGHEESSTGTIAKVAAHRIFIGAIHPFFWYIKYVEEYGLLLGTSFPNPGEIFPFEHFRLTVEIMNYARGGMLGDLVGSMPTIFLGELYANFGFLFGVVIPAFFFGFMIQLLDTLFICKMNRDKTPLVCSIYLFLVYYFSEFAETGISGLIIDENLYAVAFVSAMYLMVMKKYN